MHKYSCSNSDPSHHRSPALAYLMPLNGGAHPLDGPSHCTFSSSPSFHYSPGTERVVAELMGEAHLTMNQRRGFFSLLRSGEPLPPTPSHVEAYRKRHAQKARGAGLILLPENHQQDQQRQRQLHYLQQSAGGRGRRSYDKIVEGEGMDRGGLGAPRRRRYIPFDKEKEKERFAYRMATGKDPPCPNMDIRGQGTAVGHEEHEPSDQDLLRIRMEELGGEVRERMEFLESMDKLGNGRAYKGHIIQEIQSLLRQMRAISPAQEEAFREAAAARLERVDQVAFGKRAPYFNPFTNGGEF